MNLYEKYHSNRKLEKRVINDSDFTHNPLLRLLHIRNSKYKKVLDIGCGTGTISFYLASIGSQVVGVDISKKAINLAKINANNLGLSDKIEFLVLDFPNQKVQGKYDLVICSELLEHITDHNRAFTKIYDLLEKSGHVFFSVPLKSSFLYRHKFLNKFDNDAGHLRRYNEVEFINLVKKNNFKILKVKKNQGLLRDYLFTSTTRSLLVALANRFKFISDALTFIDERMFFLGVSNMVVLAKKL